MEPFDDRHRPWLPRNESVSGWSWLHTNWILLQGRSTSPHDSVSDSIILCPSSSRFGITPSQIELGLDLLWWWSWWTSRVGNQLVVNFHWRAHFTLDGAPT